jgi:choline monooxygenase
MNAASSRIDIGVPHAEVSQAHTPAAAFYVDPARVALELATTLRQSWQYVGHTGHLQQPGDYFTARLAGEPLLVVNDGGTIRGYFNVCRHRAGPLAEGCGHSARIVCRYHGWTYSLAGQLLRAPEMEGRVGFDPAVIHLEPVSLCVVGPMVFVALHAPVPSFDDFHPGLAAECAPFQLDRMRFVMTRDYQVEANWKVYVDNYLEGYHVPMVHPGLNREIDYKAYVTELAPRRVLQHAPVKPDTASLYHQAPGEPDASYYWLFPNIMLNLYERQLQVNVVIPDGPDRCIVRFDWFALDAAADFAQQPKFQQLLAFTEEVQAEDAHICRAVQRNLHSSAYRSGPYSPVRESGVHHFHRLMLAG